MDKLTRYKHLVKSLALDVLGAKNGERQCLFIVQKQGRFAGKLLSEFFPDFILQKFRRFWKNFGDACERRGGGFAFEIFGQNFERNADRWAVGQPDFAQVFCANLGFHFLGLGVFG